MTDKADKLFFDLCNTYFKFLETEFGCHKISERSALGAKVIYSNSDAAISIKYIPQDAGMVYVLISRLADGIMLQDPVFIKSDTSINTFDLETLLSVKDPSRVIDRPSIGILSKPFTMHVFEETIAQLANALKKYGMDILRGDFGVFSILEEIVKKRAEEIEINKRER